MGTMKKHRYEPDYAVAPGGTLQDTLDELGMDQRELSVRTGLTPKTINQIVKGHAPITYETAIRLERATGVPASLWNNLEMKYREQLTRLEERDRLQSDLLWLKKVPLNTLIQRGLVEKMPSAQEQLESVLQFFGVHSVNAWNELWLKPAGAFRASKVFESDPVATATWLRMGELEAQKIRTEPYKESVFLRALEGAKTLTRKDIKAALQELASVCAKAGVAVVFIPELKGCRASGVARWLNSQTALIQLSLRYKTDDHLWFSFFHEAGHILNDPKKRVTIEDGDTKDAFEKRADNFASDFLISSDAAAELELLGTALEVKRFALKLGIAPSIVVGRLQHDKIIPWGSPLNGLKARLQWAPPH